MADDHDAPSRACDAMSPRGPRDGASGGDRPAVRGGVPGVERYVLARAAPRRDPSPGTSGDGRDAGA